MLSSHPCSCTYQQFIPFNFWVTFHCTQHIKCSMHRQVVQTPHKSRSSGAMRGWVGNEALLTSLLGHSSSPLEWTSQNVIAGSHSKCVSYFTRKYQTVSENCAHLTLLPMRYDGSSGSTFLPTLAFVRFLSSTHLIVCRVSLHSVSLFSLVNNDVEYLFLCLLAFISLVKRLVKCFNLFFF